MADNTTKAKRPDFGKVLGAFQKNKIITSNVTLEQLAAASREISDITGDRGALAAWTFISPNYVYTGDNLADLEDQVIKQ